jgi:type VI secretion system protein ImpC
MWQQLRSLPAATSLGLAAPRFLLRHPYGPDASPTERLEFVELPTSEHDGFLWGNPAFVCACLLAQAFSRNGWDLSEDLGHDIDDLPVHVYDDAGQPEVKPCAEALLGDRAVERILDFGIMPLQSYADRGTVRLARLQSLADPPAALSGRWQ